MNQVVEYFKKDAQIILEKYLAKMKAGDYTPIGTPTGVIKFYEKYLELLKAIDTELVSKANSYLKENENMEGLKDLLEKEAYHFIQKFQIDARKV